MPPHKQRIFRIQQSPEHESILDKVENPALLKNIQLGIKVADFLGTSGKKMTRTLFIDNTTIDKAIDKGVYMGDIGMRMLIPKSILTRQVRGAGFDFDFEIDEAELKTRAAYFIEAVKNTLKSGNSRYRLTKDDRKIKYKDVKSEKKTITLTEKDGYPSCETLDAVCYLEKLKRSDVSITVLAESFKDQQERTRMIFDAIDQKPPVMNIFHGDDGKIIDIVAWDPETTSEIEKEIKTLMSTDSP